jgi:VWFA-related protein
MRRSDKVLNAMLKTSIRASRLLIYPVLAFVCSRVPPQNPAHKYTIPVFVDEVRLVFRLYDWNGRQIEDVEQGDLRLRDNGRAPKKILSFERRSGLPFRVGMVIDTSRSTGGEGRHLAAEFAARMLRKTSDQAFVMGFDFEIVKSHDWTSDLMTLQDNIRTINQGSYSRIGGTAIFDSVYRACRDQFVALNQTPEESSGTSNFILLFTDGVDNASHARMEDAVKMCQQNNVAVYGFSPTPKTILDDGQKTLRTLAAESGGRIFYTAKEGEPDRTLEQLRMIEQDMRSNYLVVYSPANLKPDGSFHQIKLDCPKRGGVVEVRSGYYARSSGLSR